MRGEIISIGTEMMTGATLDTNSAWLSERLSLLGVDVVRHTTVGDSVENIAQAVRHAAAGSDLVITTGGLGPTLDDLTRNALSEVTGQPLDTYSPALEEIEAFFKAIGRAMTPNNRCQAMHPRGTAMLANKWGTAPGIQATIAQATVFSFPGVPREMQAMFEEYVVPRIQAGRSRCAVSMKVLRTCGEGESTLANRIADLMTPGRNPLVGTTASDSIISVRIIARAESQEEAERLAQADAQVVRDRLGDIVFGEQGDTLGTAVAHILRDRNRTLAIAESCTGGLISKLVTDVPGSSQYFLGGFITYSNKQKVKCLGVSESLLAEHGAVSEKVAEAMAGGCRRATGSDYAISVTGVAGPGGGSEEKPVGLVFIGVAGPEIVRVHELRMRPTSDRKTIRLRAARAALDFLRRMLNEHSASISM